MSKNEAAVALGKLAAASRTPEEQQTTSRAGGIARAKKLPKSKRVEIARAAAAARWKKNNNT
jgi:hypothetical protein